MNICNAYPEYLKIPLEGDEFTLIDRNTGQHLEIYVVSRFGNHIDKTSFKCKEVDGEVLHHVKSKGKKVWVKEGQIIN